jgi:hypothetical protein
MRLAAVSFYRVYADGSRHLIGTTTTDSLGHATGSWTYPTGRTITVVAAVHSIRGITGNWTATVAKRV